MAGNNKPIFTASPNSNFTKTIKTQFTGTDLSTASVGTTTWLIFSAGADGSYIQKIRFRALGTNIASVGRIWLCNTTSTPSATNAFLYDEVSLPATTASASAALTNAEMPMNIALPANWTVYVTLGTTVSAGFDVTAIGGSYTA